VNFNEFIRSIQLKHRLQQIALIENYDSSLQYYRLAYANLFRSNTLYYESSLNNSSSMMNGLIFKHLI